MYKSDSGMVVIQGFPVTAEQAGINLPEGEFLVAIPCELLIEAASHLS
ncbi:hypothetical protein AFR_33110 [Actinoplanes friuliensis DSM 7358]|uniref:Uncharacterized protein n=1 Tax=Actinoplanes friuliensis DSM 7358 TaxID=1246995 RepID=U5WA68_9ACTN|nr:hypothetical protein AFR_33110 [Actinoplanes friuliensis DSM 7358]